jgi:hypothetical protein
MATSVVLARFPWLLPIRNSCELRGLCSHSYFGPRTCGGSKNQCHRSERALNQGFPFSPLMSTFVFSSQHKDAEYRSLVVGMIDSD